MGVVRKDYFIATKMNEVDCGCVCVHALDADGTGPVSLANHGGGLCPAMNFSR